MTLEQRIARLENENRKLARTMVALSGAGGVAAAVGFTAGVGAAATTVMLGASTALWLSARAAFRVSNVVQARKFEVVGDMGQVLVALGETSDGDGAVATYGTAGERLGHVSRVDEDAIALRRPTEESAPQDTGRAGTSRVESSH